MEPPLSTEAALAKLEQLERANTLGSSRLRELESSNTNVAHNLVATLERLQARLEHIVESFQELTAAEASRREQFEAQWEGKFAAYREQCVRVEDKMRARHEEQLHALQAKLERNFRTDFSGGSAQLQTMRRMQKTLVRHKRFEEALDLLKATEAQERDEAERYQEEIKAQNVAALQQLFERQAEERALFQRESQAEEDKLKKAKLRAHQSLFAQLHTAGAAEEFTATTTKKKKKKRVERLEGPGAASARRAHTARSGSRAETRGPSSSRGLSSERSAGTRLSEQYGLQPQARARSAAGSRAPSSARVGSARPASTSRVGGMSTSRSFSSLGFAYDASYYDVGGPAGGTGRTRALSPARSSPSRSSYRGPSSPSQSSIVHVTPPPSDPPSPYATSPTRHRTSFNEVSSAPTQQPMPVHERFSPNASRLSYRFPEQAVTDPGVAPGGGVSWHPEQGYGYPAAPDAAGAGAFGAGFAQPFEEPHGMQYAPAHVAAPPFLPEQRLPPPPPPYMVGGGGVEAPQPSALDLLEGGAYAPPAAHAVVPANAPSKGPALVPLGRDEQQAAEDIHAAALAMTGGAGGAVHRREHGQQHGFSSIEPVVEEEEEEEDLEFDENDVDLVTPKAHGRETRSSMVPRGVPALGDLPEPKAPPLALYRAAAQPVVRRAPAATGTRGVAAEHASKPDEDDTARGQGAPVDERLVRLEAAAGALEARAKELAGDTRYDAASSGVDGEQPAPQQPPQSEAIHRAQEAAQRAALRYNARPVSAFGAPLTGADVPVQPPPKRERDPTRFSTTGLPGGSEAADRRPPSAGPKAVDPRLRRQVNQTGVAQGRPQSASASSPKQPPPAAGGGQWSVDDFKAVFSHCRHGRYAEVKDLLKRGVPVDSRDRSGCTPLVVACQNGHGRLAKLCVRYGADVNAQNTRGNTALHFAVQYGFTALADFLVAKGAEGSITNAKGQTPYEGLGELQ